MHRLQTLAWQCPDSHKLFHTREEFIEFRKKRLLALRLARHQARIAELKRLELARQNAILSKIHLLGDFEQIAEMLMATLEVYDCPEAYLGRGKPRPAKRSRLTRLWFERPCFGMEATTHSAPEGEKTQWSSPYVRRDAWKGSIHFEGDVTREFTNMLRYRLRIHTGTGGSWHDLPDTLKGDECRRYDITMWDHDWPGLHLKQKYNFDVPEGMTIEEARKQIEYERIKYKLAT